MTRRSLRLIEALWLPTLLVAAWWLATEHSTSLYFPPLSTILDAFHQLWIFDRVPTDVAPSLLRFAVGLVLGVGAGVVIGTVLGLRPRAFAACDPLLQLMRATPIIALLPLAVVLLGTGTLEKVVVIAFAATWPTLLNTIDGVRGAHPTLLDVAAVFRLTRRRVVRAVVLPAASPQIVAGIRTSIAVAVVAMVGSELVAASNGIGYFILQAQRTYDIAGMWAGMILLGLLGYGVNGLFALIERRVLRWHASERTVSR